ncbi:MULTISPECIES: RHS repeat-associated core domain-containing protein [unclassified Pseudomonas]|uniref:RHS repeat-associated core domain-containing protein n=1 Tax=unclassified Pseudomonas TaxID=196821 RepID=UPI001482BFB7|nr:MULTISPECIES: RHS repeat-associated core domain-containing protein [unclassified Pseudomonas]
MDISVHWRTPSISAFDGRGLVAREVAYLRKLPGTPVEALITRHHHDALGRPRENRDPRLSDSSSKANLTTVYGLSGDPLKVDSVDSGRQVKLYGLAGEVLDRWDERGNRWRNTYDTQLRLRTIALNNLPDVEVLTYGPADAAPDLNVRGQLINKVDTSGSTAFGPFSLKYLPFAEQQTLLDGNVYTTRWQYDADGRPFSQTDAGGNRQQSLYNVAGQLKLLTLQLANSSVVQEILRQAHYNAEGKPIEYALGNGVVRQWIHDDANGWVTGIRSGIPGQALRQNLHYSHDRTGNVLSIKDLTLKRRFFSNQSIDGERHFTYDSLYRLASATGHDAPPAPGIPGRPAPSDPSRHLNYRQTYDYDTGGNLIKLVHSRAVGSYTRQMFIQPSSNRGVQWQEGDPDPDFSTLFDPHGNLRQLQPGMPLEWNPYNELACFTLIERETAPDDREVYSYRAGVRVYKHHQTYTPSTTHFHEVLYLPGLEIRSRDNGERLHVITLPQEIGNIRCLHWLDKQPGGVANDQLRYCLDDAQRSSLIELDQAARLISREEYYPFGGTAFLTADSELEVSYKTIRYSGQEMDDSGLYYYGRRYYAPWLQRWTSPDPTGAVDGWNLYAMVSNNPMSTVDVNGLHGDKLNRLVSNRTTRILNPPTLKNVQASDSKTFIRHNSDAQFNADLRDKVLVAHAGASIHAASGEEDIFSASDFFNIPREGGIAKSGAPFKLTLKPATHGMRVSRPYDPALNPDNPIAGGVFHLTAPNRMLDYLSKRYIQRFNDPAYPVMLYQGQHAAPISLAGLEYEVAPVHPIIQKNILNHIANSGGYLPQSAGLPGTHAEVQAGSFMLHLQQSLTGMADPANIEIVTQKLQYARAAKAFPACFNCTGTLIATYESTTAPFIVPTGKTNMTHLMWTDIQDKEATVENRQRTFRR